MKMVVFQRLGQNLQMELTTIVGLDPQGTDFLVPATVEVVHIGAVIVARNGSLILGRIVS